MSQRIADEAAQCSPLLLIAIVLLTGCASIPSDAGLPNVHRLVDERDGARPAIELAAPSDAAMIRQRLNEPLDADAAVTIAMANSPRLGTIVAELDIARADLIEAATIANPIFGAEIGFPADPYRPFELSLTQSLFDLLQLRRRTSAGRAAFNVAEQRAAAEILAFAAEVRDDYWSLLAAARQLALSREIAEAARIAAELAQRQHRAGNISDLDLENEQALYEQAKLDLARNEETVIVQREALVRNLGLRDDQTWSIHEEFPPLPAIELTADAERLTVDRRLDLAIARTEVDLARQMAPLMRAAAFGDVGVSVHHERESEGHRFTGPGVHLPIPIFNRGRAARLRAESQLLLAERHLEALSLAAESDVRLASQRLDTARARFEYYRDVVVPRRERILRLTQLEYNAMFAGIFQLLQARQQYAQALREGIEAQRDYWMARNDLERALNGVASSGQPGARHESFSPALPASERRGGGH